jgi:ribosomal protein S18 acetylase RimI-like enzyme
MTLFIRQATLADAPVIVEFNRKLALESEGKSLDNDLLVPGVRQALADRHKAIYFLAEKDGLPVGQMAITYEWSDWRNGWFWWIQSVYVRADCRRQGVFRALYEHVQQAARADPAVIGLRLYVEEANRPAQHTYESLGMTRTGYFVLEKYPLEGHQALA